MSLILLTNDDGFYSSGIEILSKKLKKLGQVFVVAPDRERSAISYALTLHRPLRAEKIREDFYTIDGTPTDCINLAIKKLLPKNPDLIIAGINKGANLGEDTTYSGTVSGAVQGTLFNIPSFAISVIPDKEGIHAFELAAKITLKIARWVLNNGLPEETTLNINVPPPPIKGIKMTKLGKKRYNPDIIEKIDPRGRIYYWIGNGNPQISGDENTDVRAIEQGFISITPLRLDLTDYKALVYLTKKDLSSIKLD
ncbi:MAG: 5'/3'-nucleotidase SurE [Candidatus Aminicenantia bacterium]